LTLIENSQIREQDGSIVEFYSITSLDQFKNKSFEELRLEDSKHSKTEVYNSTPTNSSVQTFGYQSESFSFAFFEKCFCFLFDVSNF
jgi:hypothetical protein